MTIVDNARIEGRESLKSLKPALPLVFAGVITLLIVALPIFYLVKRALEIDSETL